MAFTLFVPNVWLDMVQDRFRTVDGSQFETVLEEVEEGERIRILIRGPDFNHRRDGGNHRLSSTPRARSAAERLANTGLLLMPEGDTMRLDEPMFGSDTAEALVDFDFYAAMTPCHAHVCAG